MYQQCFCLKSLGQYGMENNIQCCSLVFGCLCSKKSSSKFWCNVLFLFIRSLDTQSMQKIPHNYQHCYQQRRISLNTNVWEMEIHNTRKPSTYNSSFLSIGAQHEKKMASKFSPLQPYPCLLMLPSHLEIQKKFSQFWQSQHLYSLFPQDILEENKKLECFDYVMVAKFLPSLFEPKQINTHLTVKCHEITQSSTDDLNLLVFYVLTHLQKDFRLETE